MTQAYGYNEVGNGLKNIKHIGMTTTVIGWGLLSLSALEVRRRFRLK